MERAEQSLGEGDGSWERVERARKEYWEKYSRENRVVWGMFLGEVIILLLGMVVSGGAKIGALMLIWLGVVVLMIAKVVVYIRCWKLAEKYKQVYKREVVGKMLLEVFPGCKYEHGQGIAYSKIDKIGMMNMGDRYNSEDLVTGEYKGVKFWQADVHIQDEHEDDDGHTSYVTRFLGRYAIFDIKKEFGFRTAIVGKRFPALRLKNRDKIKKFKKRQIESVEFHKRFKIYAEDGFETFYILDPALIERIERLGEKYKNKVALFFVDGMVHIAVANGVDAFKVPKAKKPVDFTVEKKRVEEDIRVITDLVEELRLK